MSTAVVSVRDGSGRSLDERAAPDEVVTADDAGDSTKLARLLTRILGDLAMLRRRFVPRRTTFRDVVSTGSAGAPYRVRLAHRFGAAVEWSVVGVTDPGVVALPFVSEVSDTDENTLVLDVYFPATIAVRVEET